ncbi:FtsX-like permease family protein [Streptomyces sp. NPDC050560]|uniref:FtsX-like permease family protein n=1 Tax=Streptomyces sp. NPDC050560 TaxID=3365630 RepID=UPI0037A66C51
MFRYAWQTLRYRKGGFAGAFLALLCAATLVTACGMLLETGLRGHIGTERYAAAPVVVGGDQDVHQRTVTHKHGKTKVKEKAKPLSERVWLPASTVDRLTGLSGARAVVPEVTFPAHAVADGALVPGVDGSPSYGHAWKSAALTPFTLTAGHAPGGAGDVVVDAELAARAHLSPGDRLPVQATDAPRTYTVTGIAHATGGQLARQTSLFFSDAEAARLAGRGGAYDAVGLLPKPGVTPAALADQAEKALGGTSAKVVTGGDRGPVEFLDAADARVKLVSMGGAIGGTSLLVAILVVVGTFALSIQQRHRELALLRAVAATPRQVRKLIGREALGIGLVAGVLGAAAGLPVGHWLHDRFVSLGAIPDSLQLTYSIVPFLAAVAAALLGAWVAARISARRVARIRPAEALSEAAVEQRAFTLARAVGGVVTLTGGIVLLVVLRALHTEAASTPVTYVTVMLLCMAVALLGPLVVRGAVALLRGPLQASPVGGHLAAANAGANTRRVAAAITPLALLVAMASTVLFVQSTLGDASSEQAREGTTAAWVLGSSGSGVPHAASAAAAKVPGVDAVTEVVHTDVRVGLVRYPAQGVTPAGLSHTWDPGVTAGSLDGFGPGDVALSDTAADHLHKGPGDRIAVTLGDGTQVTARVAAVYRRGLGFGDLTLDHALVAGHVDNPLASAVLVAGDVSRDRLAAAVAPYPGVSALDSGQADDLNAEVAQTTAEVNYVAMGLIVAFTAIAVVNTLAMAVSDRSREFALLRLVGTTRRQVRGMLKIETGVVVLVAGALGTGIAYAVLASFGKGMTGNGSPTFHLPLYAATLGLALLLAAAATLVPGRLALARRPAEVMGERE